MTAHEEPRWIARAKGELGQHRVPGPGNNPRILEYFRVAGVTPPEGDNTSWCMAFASWCLQDEPNPPKTAWARDGLKYGTPVDTPEYGDICIWNRGNGYGHINFFLGYADDGRLICIGGNQDGGDTHSEVTISKRSTNGLLGFRRVPVAEKEAVPSPAEDKAQDEEQDEAVAASEVPAPPPAKPQLTASEVEDGLRSAGSRTVVAADMTENHTSKVAGLTFMEGITRAIHDMAPITDLMRPFIKGFEIIILLGIVYYAVKVMTAQTEIKAARVDDHMTGANTGRILNV